MGIAKLWEQRRFFGRIWNMEFSEASDANKSWLGGSVGAILVSAAAWGCCAEECCGQKKHDRGFGDDLDCAEFGKDDAG